MSAFGTEISGVVVGFSTEESAVEGISFGKRNQAGTVISQGILPADSTGEALRKKLQDDQARILELESQIEASALLC